MINSHYNEKKPLQLSESFSKHNMTSKENSLQCQICKESPIILPTSGGCGHYFCYYCIASNLEAVGDEGFTCPVCSKYLKKDNMNFPGSVRNA